MTSNTKTAANTGSRGTLGRRRKSERTFQRIAGAAVAAIATSSLVPHVMAAAVVHSWIGGTSGGNWSLASNWSGSTGVPNAAGDQAKNATDGAVTTTLDEAVTIGSLRESIGGSGSWTIVGSGFSFTLNGTGSGIGTGLNDAAIQAGSAGSFTINPNITLASSTDDVGSASSGGITIVGNITASTTATLNFDSANSSSTDTVSGTIGATGSQINIANTSTNGAISLSNAIGGAQGTGATVTITNTAMAGSFSISGSLGASVTTVTQDSTNSAMTLSGANTNYDGSTLLSVGTLKLGSATALGGNGTTSGTGGTLTIASGTTLDASATTAISTVNAETWNGNFTFGGSNTLNTGTGAISFGANVQLTNAGANTLTVGGAVSGSGNLTLVTSAAGGLTFTGGLTGADNLVLNANSTGNITFSTTAVNNAGTITNSGGSTGTAAISGLGGDVTAIIENSPTSTLTLSGTNTQFTGSAVVSAGTLKMGGSSALGFANTVAVGTGGTFDINANNETIAGLNNISGSGGTATNGGASATLTLGGSGSYNFGGVITATTLANLSLTMGGTGVQALNGASTYQGATTVNSGTLKLDFSATGAAASNIINSSSALKLGGGTLQIVGASGGSTQAFNGTTVQAGGNVFSAAPVSGTIPTVNLGTLAGAAGDLVQFNGPAYNSGASSGTTLGGSTQAATATITATTNTLFGGLIAYNTNTTSDRSAGAYATVGSYDWAAINSGVQGSATAGNVIGGSQVSGFYTTTGTIASGNLGNIDLTGSASLQNSTSSTIQTIRFNANTSYTLTSGISGLGGILVTPNVSTNNVTISQGTGNLTAGASTSGASGITVWQNNTAGELIVNAGYSNGSNSAATSSYTQGGPGTVLLNGVNGYTGQTFLDGGTTVIAAYSGLGGGSAPSSLATVNLGGGTLVGNASSVSTDFSSGVLRNVFLFPSGGGLAATSGNTLTVGGVISGSGPLTIGTGTLAGTGGALVGSGAVTLTNAESYTGSTTIGGSSTLSLLNSSSTNNIASSKAISIGSGSTLNVNGLTGSQIVLASGQALGGTGMVTGGVVVSSGSTISAGTKTSLGTGATNATGTLTTGNETWNAGAAYAWKDTMLGTASAAQGSGGSGTTGTPSSWDDVAMSALSLSSLGGSNPSFTIQVSDTSTLAPTGYGTYSWIIAQSTAGVTAPSGYNIFVNSSTANSNLLAAPSGGGTAAFALDTSGLSLSGAGATTSTSAFTLELVSNGASGDNLVLDYTAAPEPGAAMLVLAGALPMLTGRRRRKNRSGAPVLVSAGAGGSHVC
jgi:fibronectin-binding autotransporter adhesin